MNKRLHAFLNKLVELEHPYADMALKRAIFATKRKLPGCGLTRIPLEILQEDYPSKSDAQALFDSIDDSTDIEAGYLAQKDTVLEQTYGFDVAVQYYYDKSIDVDKDISTVDVGIDLTPTYPSMLLANSNLPRQVQQIMEETARVFEGDVVRGYDRKDSDRKRLHKKLKKLVTDIGSIR